MVEDETINIDLNPKKISCHLQDGLAQLCPFCDIDSKICIAKLHCGHCKLRKVDDHY